MNGEINERIAETQEKESKNQERKVVPQTQGIDNKSPETQKQKPHERKPHCTMERLKTGRWRDKEH